MIKGENVLNMSHEEWLAERKKGIGGSDAAAIAGYNPWKSAASVFIEKTSKEPPVDFDNEKMRIGRDLEDYVAKRFEEATGKKVRRNNFMLHLDGHPEIFADIDREVVGENAILECKTTGSYGKKDWETEPPMHYQFQCLHYMLVTGAERAYIACLIGNEAFVWYEVERDEEALETLLDLELNFWKNNVLADVCPDPDGSANYDKYLAEKYPRANEEEEITLLPSTDNILNRLDEVKDLIKKLDAEKKELEQNIKLEMGEATTAYTWDGERKVTWKNQSRTGIDSKRLKAERPEIAEEYSKTTASRIFKA